MDSSWKKKNRPKNAVLAGLWEEKLNRRAVLVCIVWTIGYEISDVSLEAVFGLQLVITN